MKKGLILNRIVRDLQYLQEEDLQFLMELIEKYRIQARRKSIANRAKRAMKDYISGKFSKGSARDLRIIVENESNTHMEQGV